MINQNRPYKIGMIGDCLGGGGAEKVHALLSVYFSRQGFEVHNCILVDLVDYEFSGSLLNIGEIAVKSSSVPRKIQRFRALKRFISENNFDFIIDFRMRDNYLLSFLSSKFIYPKNTFYTVHSGIWKFYFPENKLLANFIYKNKNIVAVSKAIAGQVSKFISANVNLVYNPIDLQKIALLKEEKFSETGKFILAAGSMNNENKQFDKLISAYANSALPQNGIRLVILGAGKNQGLYEKLAENSGLKSMIEFYGFVQNPFPYYKNALFSVLSSKNEGFPNVLIEALSCEIPVVSFDCFSGPDEIISDKENGLLVEDQNFEKLREAMELMAFDEKLYYHCKRNSAVSVAKFDIEIIGAQWLELFEKQF